ncbi:MAG: hypothetical protein MUF54_13150 [Polyangiaceae bacterium]|jgi:hypothetical protein|nr:hypothetical protein [Polyangiaceae bacterium]
MASNTRKHNRPKKRRARAATQGIPVVSVASLRTTEASGGRCVEPAFDQEPGAAPCPIEAHEASDSACVEPAFDQEPGAAPCPVEAQEHEDLLDDDFFSQPISLQFAVPAANEETLADLELLAQPRWATPAARAQRRRFRPVVMAVVSGAAAILLVGIAKNATQHNASSVSPRAAVEQVTSDQVNSESAPTKHATEVMRLTQLQRRHRTPSACR